MFNGAVHFAIAISSWPRTRGRHRGWLADHPRGSGWQGVELIVCKARTLTGWTTAPRCLARSSPTITPSARSHRASDNFCAHGRESSIATPMTIIRRSATVVASKHGAAISYRKPVERCRLIRPDVVAWSSQVGTDLDKANELRDANRDWLRDTDHAVQCSAPLSASQFKSGLDPGCRASCKVSRS
jgi:hypothetical protein